MNACHKATFIGGKTEGVTEMGDGTDLGEALVTTRVLTILRELEAVPASSDRAQDVAAAVQRAADELISSGHRDEATVLYRGLLDMARRVLGESHPTALTTLHNLAVLCDSSGQAAEAEALWAEARAALAADRRV